MAVNVLSAHNHLMCCEVVTVRLGCMRVVSVDTEMCPVTK